METRRYCYLTGTIEEPEKEGRVFLFPPERFSRNTPDEIILADWDSYQDHDASTRKRTPDEFMELCNDEMFDDQNFWVRYIIC